MEKYNKEDLIAEYQKLKEEEGHKIPNKQARDDVDTVFLAISNVLEKGKNSAPNNRGIRAKLQVINFGIFNLVARKEREYNNPQDKSKKSVVPAHNEVTFKEGKMLGESVN